MNGSVIPSQIDGRVGRQRGGGAGVVAACDLELARDARPADLRRMYAAACRKFLAIKRELDPRGVWGSDCLDLLAALAR